MESRPSGVTRANARSNRSTVMSNSMACTACSRSDNSPQEITKAPSRPTIKKILLLERGDRLCVNVLMNVLMNVFIKCRLRGLRTLSGITYFCSTKVSLIAYNPRVNGGRKSYSIHNTMVKILC